MGQTNRTMSKFKQEINDQYLIFFRLDNSDETKFGSKLGLEMHGCAKDHTHLQESFCPKCTTVCKMHGQPWYSSTFLVIMHDCACMHGQPCIIFGLQIFYFLSSHRLIEPLSFPNHHSLPVARALSSDFFKFEPRYL